MKKGNMLLTSEEVIRQLGLSPHPEGGFYKEVYRAQEKIEAASLPARYGSDRCFSTSIYFLLTGESPSRFHSLHSDETFYYHYGAPITVHWLQPDGSYERFVLGPGPNLEMRFQLTIPRGVMFAAEVEDRDSFCLIGCNVAPGFDFRDFSMGDKETLLQQFPDQCNLINRLS